MSEHNAQTLNAIQQCVSPEEAIAPLQAIEAFFTEDYHLPEAIHLLKKWVSTAFSEEKRLSRKNLLRILYLQERLTLLLEATYRLNQSGSNENTVEETFYTADKQGITSTCLYATNNMGRFNAWHVFPRHLSAKEYNNPRRVFKKCFRTNTIADWKAVLQQLFIGASQEGSVYDILHNKSIYDNTILLFKLIEACHVLKVRETSEKKE